MKNKDKNGRYCNKCGKRKFFFKSYCFFCFKKTNSNIHIFISDTIIVRDFIKMRHMRLGFKKFIAEILSGWFPSNDMKLKNGVNKIRIVDRGNDEYHEVVKDYKTGKMLRECHEPLSVHRNNKI